MGAVVPEPEPRTPAEEAENEPALDATLEIKEVG
jgi:hypothetical protein